MTPTFEAQGVKLYHADCLSVLPTLEGVDAVISDPPFSARTHAGHDAVNGDQFKNGDGANRVALGYAAWGVDEVRAICQALPPKGWACFITDHTLARDWERELNAVGRYVFAPLPCVTPGRSVRLTGDGPSSWTDWLIPSRTKVEIKWGTLPGCYEGRAGEIEHMGGKPIGMMTRIVMDYSAHGDTVLDFCMGACTTGIACIRTGRNFIGIEKDPAHFATAVERIKRELAQGVLPLAPPANHPTQQQFAIDDAGRIG